MAHLTESLPKPMLPVDGKPMLEHVLDHLRAGGMDEALLVIGYRGELIREHFADYPMRITYQVQQEVNGTARAALLAREFCGNDSFLLTFGDILCSAGDYHGLMDLLAPPAVGVLGVKYVADPAAGAAVYEQDNQVIRIIEKPAPGTSQTHWNSAGVYAFTPLLFDELERVPVSPRGEYELTSAIAQLIERGEILRKYAIRDDWMDVGRPEDLERAADYVRRKSAMR